MYNEISDEELYSIVLSGLPDLERFLRKIGKFIQGDGNPGEVGQREEGQGEGNA